MTKQAKTGSCLCGAVAYEVDGPLRPIVACHCTQCRKLTGHHMAATAALLEDFHLTRDDGLQWYRSSDSAKRGFCSKCGSTLFWQANGSPQISITAGSLDGETGVELWGHIFVSDKGDYYDIPESDIQTDEKPVDFPKLGS